MLVTSNIPISGRLRVYCILWSVYSTHLHRNQNIYGFIWFLISCAGNLFSCFDKPKSWSIHNISRSMTDLPFLQKITFRWEILPAKVRNRRDVLFSFEDFIGTCSLPFFYIEHWNKIVRTVSVSFGGAASLFLCINFYQIAKIIYKLIEILTSTLSSGLLPRKETNAINN